MNISNYEKLTDFISAVRLISDTIYYKVEKGKLTLSVEDSREKNIHKYTSRLSGDKIEASNMIMEGINTKVEFKFKENLEEGKWQ